VAYSQLRASMFDSAQDRSASPPQQLRYEARSHFSVLAIVGRAWELYAAFGVLTAKEEAFEISHSLAGWLASRQALLFG
jgi:hypothetical protein